MEIIITILLAANTATVGIAAALLFKRLDTMDASIARAHSRIDSHTVNSSIHCSPEKQTRVHA